MQAVEQMLTAPNFGIDPYPLYPLLHAGDPIYWSENWQCWMVSHYENVVDVLHQPNLFSNVDRITTLLNGLAPEERQEFAILERHFSTGLVHSDPPQHTRLRKLATHAFTPRMVKKLEPRIAEFVNDVLDKAVQGGKLELIGDLAYPLPATVIAEMLGAPREDQDQFKVWSSSIGALGGSGTATVETFRMVQNNIHNMREYLRGLLAERRKNPQDDLLTLFIQAEEKGDMLNEDEVLSICVTLLSAGHETTTSLIGNGILALLRHPDQLDLLRNNPDLIQPAVEEFLRYDPPLQRTWRRIAEDTTYAGQPLKQNQLLTVWLGAANYDSARFANPTQLEITRKNNQHMGLGYGVHYCLGGPLARLEGAIAINLIVQRLQNLRLATDEVVWKVQGLFRGLEALPLEFD